MKLWFQEGVSVKYCIFILLGLFQFATVANAKCTNDDIYNSFGIAVNAAEVIVPNGLAVKCATGRGFGGYISTKVLNGKISFIGECLVGDQSHVWQTPDMDMVGVPDDETNLTELQFAGEIVGKMRTADNWAQMQFKIIQGDQVMSGVLNVSCGPKPFPARVTFEFQRQNGAGEFEFWGQGSLDENKPVHGGMDEGPLK